MPETPTNAAVEMCRHLLKTAVPHCERPNWAKSDAQGQMNPVGSRHANMNRDNLVTTACGLANLESLEVRTCGLWSVEFLTVNAVPTARGLANLLAIVDYSEFLRQLPMTYFASQHIYKVYLVLLYLSDFFFCDADAE
ncbi:hypothetical protein AVEN_56789-1 [Araneus ventricosus]|uniref:Uncharacterized protein n=1 Tax=Araneus ventricosus TaxID=182803 RepID=A0A4Y2H9X9_ARAVE|nr:hypothetical protein AVEN_56789-1 [Araneus ventricosus]